MALIDASELHALARHQTAHAAAVPTKARALVAGAAFRTVGLAQVKAPVDTGALKNSIDADVQGLSFEVGSGIEYAVYQELGTSEQPAQPYLAPAFDEVETGFVRSVSDLGVEIN